ncbi:hypothetical protein DFJ63DRAFT_275846, partial [Scheffersomyces coipomensis]|uniref:uncharacterized protein n=1 Tax=Scheffersomyces coipomensis TaxID=1788519 RepID=UPI00315D3D27
DVASLNACPTLDGTIEITGDEIVSLQLPSVQEIDGDINIFNSSSINNINLNQLSSINGSLSITALTALASIDFTSLENVEDLELISLPSLSLVTFLKGLQTVNDLQLSDTALQTIQGFNTFDTVNILNINNNKNISTIDLPLQTVTNTLLISFNNDHAEIVLDDLIWASNLTIQDVESISAQNLTAVNGSLIIAYNIFDTLALDNLTAVGGSVEIFANDELTDLSLSDLSTIGGELRLFNNTILESITNDSFASLTKIKGAFNVAGDIANFTLPKLTLVAGDFSLISTNEDFDCSPFNKLHSSSSIQGHDYTC